MQSNVDTSPIASVQEGMRVVDATGDDIGKVEYVQMGEPDAVTAEGNEPHADTLLGRMTETFLPHPDAPDVPEPLRTNLRRTGFLKIDGRGVLGHHRYVSSERVRSVEGDVVKLDASKDALVSEE